MLNRLTSRLFAYTLLLVFPFGIYAQCCSSGSPAGASTFVGLLNKKTIRVITFYRNNFSDSYYSGTKKETSFTYLKNTSLKFTGLTIGYGLTKRFTAEYEMGYFISKVQRFEFPNDISRTVEGFGLGNGFVSVKYGAYVKPARNIELTVGAGLKFPFSQQPQFVDNVIIPRDLQPSTGVFGITGLLFFNKGFPAITLRVFSLNKYELNGSSKYDFSTGKYNADYKYKYGNMIMNSVFISKKILNNFFGVVQFRSENRQPDYVNAVLEKNTGSEVLYISPQLSYSIAGLWHVAAMADYPVYKNYTGKQMTPKYSLALSLTRDFNCCKAKK
jgi:hypothetical protein